jgi:hypothetical protein
MHSILVFVTPVINLVLGFFNLFLGYFLYSASKYFFIEMIGIDISIMVFNVVWFLIAVVIYLLIPVLSTIYLFVRFETIKGYVSYLSVNIVLHILGALCAVGTFFLMAN